MATQDWVKEEGYRGPRTRARWRRTDGAAVVFAMGPSKQQWIAYKPDPSEDYLARYSKRGFGWPRRWSSAEAAMRTVDKEFPLKETTNA